MLKNTFINMAVIKRIAEALGELNKEAIYVGGAVVSIYADDPAADDVRPTKDIDISLEIASVGELELLREKLTEKGFVQKAESDVICRFYYEDIMMDVMDTKPIGWAAANTWFASGFKNLIVYQIDHQHIRLLSFPYFLASKFEAFNNRGIMDARTSKDFEDITYLLDNRMEMVTEILNCSENVRSYLQKEFSIILKRSVLKEALLAHLYYETQTERFQGIITKLKRIVG